MFTKLLTKHSLTIKPYGALMYRFGKEIDNKFRGISYYHPSDEIVPILFSTIPNKYHSCFIPSVMVINYAEIPPHIDNGILSTINFYVETSDAVTKFYKRTLSTTSSKLPNQTSGSLFDESTLDFITSFKAEPNDIYVLDVKEIHSVSCAIDRERFVYSLQSSIIPYEEVITVC